MTVLTMRYLRGPFRRHRAGHRTSEIQVMLRRTARVLIFSDLPLNFHPAAIRASANVTPFGAVSVPA